MALRISRALAVSAFAVSLCLLYVLLSGADERVFAPAPAPALHAAAIAFANDDDKAKATTTTTTTTMSFVSLGDWGQPGATRDTVIAALERYVAGDTTVALVAALGDNFYPAGVDADTSPRWESEFEQPFGRLALPWYAILGNHDHYGNVTAQLAYTQRSQRWNMPARFYTKLFPLPRRSLRLVFLDTLALLRGDWQQWVWLEKQLYLGATRENRAAMVTVVVGHEPVYTTGEHAAVPELQSRLSALLVRYKVLAYIGGHNHLMEHIHADGVDYFVNGVGSSTTRKPQRRLDAGAKPIFSAQTVGFAVHAFEDTGRLTTTFVRADGTIVHRTVSQPAP